MNTLHHITNQDEYMLEYVNVAIYYHIIPDYACRLLLHRDNQIQSLKEVLA